MDICPNCEKRAVAKGKQFCSPKCEAAYERDLELLKAQRRIREARGKESKEKENDSETATT